MRSLVFVVAGLCALTALAHRPQNSDRRLRDAVDAKPFRSGQEYSFRYDAQVATGLSPKASEQKAATRLEAKVKLAFRSNDKAILRMEDIRFGQRNEEMYEPHEMQPMRIFEQKPVDDEQERQLRLPVQITIEDGVVKRIQFHEQDAPWSKNVKRGVINLVQVNLKRQNAEESNEQDVSESTSCNNDQASCVFTLKEITLEGKCKTTYTLNKDGQKQSSSDDKPRFNVTKAIDFQQCSEVADVAYGFDSQEIQPECTFKTDAEEDQKAENKLPQGARCDPKEVKQEKIDRSTVYRFTLQGKPESEYGIESATVLSQYAVKNLNAEQHQALHHVTVLAELVYEDDSQASSKTTSDSGISSKTESLLYNAEREVQEKRFFMDGDEEFGRQSPFEQVPNKAGLAKKITAHMLAGWTQNIDTEATLHFSRLVDVLRMSTVSELQKIWKMLVEGKSGMELKAEQQERLEQILQDALAAAGTRNTIHLLVEKVIKEEIPAGKAVHALKMLTSVPAPSQKLIKQVERLCKSETSDKNGPLKQACWLAYGSLVADLCRERPVKVQMPEEIRTEDRCPRDAKEQFKSTFMQQYKSADSTYEKILALKALGNAALDIAVHELEQIYKDQREETTVRMQAIDSLRRLRTQMPHRIHRSLLPLFENTREQPEVRMAALAMIMHTVPEKAVLDQITYALLHDRSENVKSFVYTTAKTLVNSNIPSEKELGEHLENALKLAKIEPSTMRASRQYNVPIYSQAEKEGLILGMSSMFSTRNALPAHIAARVDGLLNKQLKRNALEVHLSQRDVERWYEKAIELLGEGSQRPTRGQRSQRRGAEELRSFYSEQGYKSRRSGNEKEEPFGMLCVRILDVDHVILPVAEDLMPRVLKDALRGDKPKISEILRAIPEEAKHFGMSAAMLFAEKQVTIPTSVGLPLRFRQSLPILTAVHGSVQLQLNGARPKAQLSMQTVATPVYEQKVEVWTPIAAAGMIRRESIELSLPLDVQGQAEREQMKITVKLPQEKHVLAVLRTLPATYTDETSEKSEAEREPQLKTVHSPRVEHLYREMRQELGKSIDVPVVVRAHYYAPATVNYRGIIDAWKNTPNTIRVEYEPTSETPEKLELQATWSLFEKAASGKLELNDFFRETKFNEVYSSEETESMDLDDRNDRNRKLNSFIDAYKPKGTYKHNVKISAKTIGGRRQHSASMEVNGQCEPRMTYCKVDLKADTNRDWQLTAQAKVLLPETVKDVGELERLSEKQKHFVAQLQAQWNQPERQEIRVSVQGEPAMTRQQRKVEQELARHNPAYKALTAFVNKYDLEASYTLSSQAQNAFNKVYEAVKAAYFWQSNAELKEGRDGTVHISAIIDPITRRHANVTVKTPSQRLRISSMDLPPNTRPLPFVRRQSTPMHSLPSIMSALSNGIRAECRITNEKVRTFDDVVYRSALPKCFAAVAKDCSGDEPRFAVYMKRISEGSQEKKLKVITEDQIIEVKPKGDGLVVKVNDERLDEDWEVQARHGIYVNSEQQEAVIDVSGVRVHFNGEEATISVSPLYKNGVCGLCGHYDGEREDELRMKNNEHASDVEEFHRSYVHQTDDECTKEELDAFYGKQTFRPIRTDESSDEWDMDEFFENGRPQRSQALKKWRKQDRSSEEKPEPIEATEIIEYHEKMCFSTKPVKKCPQGTEPESINEKSVPFKCYQRGSMNAQRMLKKARNGDLLDELRDEEPSFSHSVKVPRTCVEAY